MKHGPFTFSEIIDFLINVCSALDYTHSKGIIHRDLKPANILLDELGNPILTDFGLARIIHDNSISGTHNAYLGTPEYMAPEIWNSGKASFQSDIYSLACIVYEMATGQKLFPVNNLFQAAHAHAQGAILPNKWPYDFPKGFSQVLQKALSSEPSNRYASATSLLDSILTLEELGTRSNINTIEEKKSYLILQKKIIDYRILFLPDTSPTIAKDLDLEHTAGFIGIVIPLGSGVIGAAIGWIIGGLAGVYFVGLENARQWGIDGLGFGILLGVLVALTVVSTEFGALSKIIVLFSIVVGLVTGLILGGSQEWAFNMGFGGMVFGYAAAIFINYFTRHYFERVYYIDE